MRYPCRIILQVVIPLLYTHIHKIRSIIFANTSNFLKPRLLNHKLLTINKIRHRVNLTDKLIYRQRIPYEKNRHF